MRLKLKPGVNPEVLREYGFRTGKEWADRGVKGFTGEGYEYKHTWYFRLKMVSEYIVDCTEEGLPSVSISVNDNGWFYVECIPEYSYSVTNSELGIVIDTIYQLTKAGLIED